MQEPRICPLIFSAQNSSYVLRATAFEDLSSEKIASLMSQFAYRGQGCPFERGESIKTIDGPFAGFTGIVDEIHTDQNMLKAVVTLLGRSTPIALDFWQVEQGSRLRANWANWARIGELANWDFNWGQRTISETAKLLSVPSFPNFSSPISYGLILVFPQPVNPIKRAKQIREIGSAGSVGGFQKCIIINS